MYRQLISNSWKACLLFVCVFFSGITVKADDSLYSPNKKIGVSWDNPVKGLRVIYKKGDVPISVVQLENIGLQLQRASGDEFNYVSSSAVTSIREEVLAFASFSAVSSLLTAFKSVTAASNS